MSSKKIKVTFTEKEGNYENPYVQSMVHRLEDFQFIFCNSEDEIEENLCDSEVIITSGRGITKEELSKAEKLKLIQYIGTGYDSADLKASSEAGVMVTNVPSRGTGNAESVAETAIMHMLLLAKQQRNFKEAFDKKRLYWPEGTTLWKKRALVIGLGNLGHTISERLIALGMEVWGANRTVREDFYRWGIKKVFSLERLTEAVEGCRFVIIALPSNGDTENLVNRAVLKSMGRDSWIINVGRANVLEKEALLEALKEKWIAGGALDVIWNEPIDPDDPLLDEPNLSISPHVGGATEEFSRGVFSYIEKNLQIYRQGQKPLSIVH